jgi:HD-GYP domain-containing protein (c-di-GMP phosphodiesterase class II)
VKPQVRAVPRRRGRILSSLLLLLFGVGVLPLVGTSWQLVSRSREILELDQKATQLDKARSLSQQVSVYVDSLRSQVAAIARTLELEAGDGPFTERVAALRGSGALSRYEDTMGSRFYSISVIDTEGSGARAGQRLQEPVLDQLLQEGVVRSLQGKAMISHPFFSVSVKEPLIVISEPVRRGESQVVGAVSVVASLGQLWIMSRELNQGELFDVYVVDSRGRMVAHSSPERVQGDLDMSNVEIVRQFMASQGRVGTTVPFAVETPAGPVKMLGTYTGVPDTGWGVIVQVEERKAYYSALQMRDQSFWLVALVTFLAAVLGVLFAREISRPIDELARGARRLAAGDYGTRVAVKTTNEVGVLADAFNQMGDEIQKSIEQIRQAAARNKELFMGSIRMLANAIDEKDPYTRGHSERVAFYSMLIAKHLGMAPDEVERVHLSGIIHDVGKIGIEDKILRKPAALTDEEYEIMKQHPRKGEHILEAVPLLKQLAGAGLMHHENVDGSGYPDGLKGEQIPLLGRIVSVADAFDAMTTDRPYSKAMTFEAALARLRFLAHKKFDDGCVTAIEKAAASGDLTPAKALRASVAARRPDAVTAAGR